MPLVEPHLLSDIISNNFLKILYISRHSHNKPPVALTLNAKSQMGASGFALGVQSRACICASTLPLQVRQLKNIRGLARHTHPLWMHKIKGRISHKVPNVQPIKLRDVSSANREARWCRNSKPSPKWWPQWGLATLHTYVLKPAVWRHRRSGICSTLERDVLPFRAGHSPTGILIRQMNWDRRWICGNSRGKGTSIDCRSVLPPFCFTYTPH